jgi:hypothetical protein
MMNVQALLTNGLLRMVELANQLEETFTAEYMNLSHLFPMTHSHSIQGMKGTPRLHQAFTYGSRTQRAFSEEL